LNVPGRRRNGRNHPATDRVIARIDLPGAKGNQRTGLDRARPAAGLDPVRGHDKNCWCSTCNRNKSGARFRSVRGPDCWPTRRTAAGLIYVSLGVLERSRCSRLAEGRGREQPRGAAGGARSAPMPLGSFEVLGQENAPAYVSPSGKPGGAPGARDHAAPD